MQMLEDESPQNAFASITFFSMWSEKRGRGAETMKLESEKGLEEIYVYIYKWVKAFGVQFLPPLLLTPKLFS